MRRKLIIIAVIGALVLAPSVQARPTQLMPGVTYERTLEWGAAGPVAMHVVRAPKPGGLYSLTPLLSNQTITGLETLSSMQRGASPRMTSIGVNGDYFSYSGSWPTGVLMRGGVIEHHPATNRGALGVDVSGNVHIDPVKWAASWKGPSTVEYAIRKLNETPGAHEIALYTPAWGPRTPAIKGTAVILQPFPPLTPRRDVTGVVTSVVTDQSVPIPADGAVLVGRGDGAQDLLIDAPLGAQITVRVPLAGNWAQVTDAIGGGPTLVKGGRPIAKSGEALTAAQVRGRAPRTAVGQRADGGIVMLAVDGRRAGWSIGITTLDLALALMRYGCVTGLALDSGGSTTVAFEGKVLNRPSDRGGERSVSDGLVVAYTGVFAPAPTPPTLSPNADRAGDREALAYKLVRPSTVSAKLIAPDGTARELFTGQRNPGRYRLSWDGTDAAGAAAPEGVYHWNVSATDDLGRPSSDDRVFRLDNTLGFLRVSPGARRVDFTLSREARVRVTIETPGGAVLRTVATGVRPVGPVAVLWNGRNAKKKPFKRGTYAVRVSATSELGVSALRLPVKIGR
jgi:hypothetical protein